MFYGPCKCLLTFFCIVTIFARCGSLKMSSDHRIKNKVDSNEVYAIVHVNIIPMTAENKILGNASIVIKNKKIVSINGPVPANARIIDGNGKWLIPGLVDMHVHNLADVSLSSGYPTKGANVFFDTQDFMLLYLAQGVTTVFELNARPEHFAQRNEIIQGKVIGPRVALAFLIDGGSGSGNIANTPSEGRQTVRIAKAQGYEFIKVYSSLNIETYKAITDEAGKQTLKVIGHIPNIFNGRLEEAFVPHFDMIAHAEEFSKQSKTFSDQDARRFAKLAKTNNTWLAPTLTTMVRIAAQSRSIENIADLRGMKYVHPLIRSKWLYSNRYNQDADSISIMAMEKMIQFHKRLVKIFKEAKVPMVAGTDAGTSGVVWGYSLHDEIELMVNAGLTTEEALASATRLPATWLSIGEKIGTVETGKYADLVLLDANPLENISNTRKIAGVFMNGRWTDRKVIEAMLSALEKKNLADKDKFDWKKRSDL